MSKRTKAQSTRQKKPLLSLPYSERQKIVIASDNIIKAENMAIRGAGGETKGINWKYVAENTIKLITPFYSDLDAMTNLAVEALKAWNRFREKGFDVVTVSHTEAEELNFPVGHPRNGIIYVGHPDVAEIYYTASDFHRLTFEHKFCEAINLLMHLGAKKLKVIHKTGWSNEFSAILNVPLGVPNTKIGASGGKTASKISSLLYEANLKGHKEPVLPKNLSWYHHEQTWQEIANGRLNFGLEDFSLGISYKDDFGINAGFKLAAQNAGLELGGSFQEHEETQWRIEGTFQAIKQMDDGGCLRGTFQSNRDEV